MISIEKQIRIISKGAAEIIDVEELKSKLKAAQKEGRKLIVKFGLDPTAPDIHLGHTVVLRKAKQLQDLGHKVVIIIGDTTAMIGDPTGKSKTRKQLTKEQVLNNAETYKNQMFRVLDSSKTELRFNSEWLSKFSFKEILELTSKYTVTRMLEREDFKNRFKSQKSIAIHEFLYPLMQGYDSVAIDADIELGGTDQKFNVLMGRTLQKEYKKEKQVAIFMPILEGIDGVEKMSKSLGNYIGIEEEPKDIYGKVMSIPDNMIVKYYELVTDIDPDNLDNIKKNLKEEKVNPRDIKMDLAKEITRLYNGNKKAEEAEEYFKSVFQKKNIPTDIKEIEINDNLLVDGKMDIVKLIVSSKSIATNSEARRLVKQGAVRISGNKILEIENVEIKNEDVLQVGKRKFFRIKILK